MSTLGSTERPLRVAIIGAGPSGFYAADALFKSDLTVKVDAFDRLPSPYGLLRGGVAPDHQQMKSVGKYYERVASKNADSFSFVGNVEVGTDITIEELRQYYDALVFSYGAESDKKLGLPGENLPGVHSAREFVAWYNGHPDYVDSTFDLSQESVMIIGQGNVAIDVARILAKTVEELKTSDIAQHALDQLAESKVKNIYLLGRRGPAQAAFTSLEMKEMGELDESGVVLKAEDMNLSAADLEELEDPKSNKSRKNIEVLQAILEKDFSDKSRQVHLEFYQNPSEILGDISVSGLEVESLKLEGDAFKQKVVSTGNKSVIDCGLLFRSIGYKGLGLPGLPYDDKWGVVPNEKGRVIDDAGKPLSGLYTSGWIKRGPTGVLGTNKPDSTETIACLLEDVAQLTPCKTPSTDAVLQLLESRNIRSISYEDWTQINAEEVKRGEAIGKPREKFVTVEDMLSVLTAQPS